MNRKEFDKNISELQSKMNRYAYAITGDREEANDLTQETNLKAIERHKTYRKGNMLAWLKAIMRNIFFEKYRKKKQVEILPIQDFDGSYSIPDERFEFTLRRVFGELTADEQEILQLRFCHEMKFREIAERMNMPESTVKTKIHRLKIRFRGLRK